MKKKLEISRPNENEPFWKLKKESQGGLKEEQRHKPNQPTKRRSKPINHRGVYIPLPSTFIPPLPLPWRHFLTRPLLYCPPLREEKDGMARRSRKIRDRARA